MRPFEAGRLEIRPLRSQRHDDETPILQTMQQHSWARALQHKTTTAFFFKCRESNECQRTNDDRRVFYFFLPFVRPPFLFTWTNPLNSFSMYCQVRFFLQRTARSPIPVDKELNRMTVNKCHSKANVRARQSGLQLKTKQSKIALANWKTRQAHSSSWVI
jgi:hypothetical protein